MEHICTVGKTHRRRIELEDKAKVVPSVLGTESLPRKLFCLANDLTQLVYLEETVELNRPPNRRDDLCLVV